MDRVKRVTIEEMVYAHAATRTECSDTFMLDRYLHRLKNHELEPRAVLYYGTMIEKNEIKYMLPFAAEVKYVLEGEGFPEQLRMRSGLSAQDLILHAKRMKENLSAMTKNEELQAHLREQFKLPRRHPRRIIRLLRRLQGTGDRKKSRLACV